MNNVDDVKDKNRDDGDTHVMFTRSNDMKNSYDLCKLPQYYKSILIYVYIYILKFIVS